MDQEDNKTEPPIEINHTQLSPEALNGLVENYIIRHGTDYGAVEVSHEKKVAQIKKQISSGHVKIIFDPNIESATLMTKTDFQKAIS